MNMNIMIGGNDLNKSLSLARQIESEFKYIKVVCVSDSTKVLYKELTENPPDTLIIERFLADGRAAFLLDNIKERKFRIIIYSNEHNNLMLGFYNVNAIYCLQDPFSHEELDEALDLAFQYKIADAQNQQEKEKENKKEESVMQLDVRVSNELVYINADEIMYIEARGSYARYVLKNKEITVSKTLKEALAILKSNFIRTHKSFAVNLNYYKKLITRKGVYDIKILNNELIPISRDKKQEVLKIISDHIASGKIRLNKRK